MKPVACSGACWLGLVLLCTCGELLAQTGASPTPRQLSTREQRQRSERWLAQGRQVPHESAAALRYHALAQKTKMRASVRTLPGLSNSGWTSLGPAPLASDASGVGLWDYNWVSGRATAVAIDSADATGSTVYVGGAYGGVWKSTNALQTPSGVVWNSLTDDQPTLAVGAIAIQPQLSNPDPNKSVILVGTGEANASGDSYYGLGILRSADAGNSWTLIPSDSTGTRSFSGMAFSKISFSSSNPNLVVAAAAQAQEGLHEGLVNPITGNLGLYYSTNAGVSWSFANVQDAGVITAPNSATAVTYNAVAGAFFAALQYHGFYSSSDGINWTRLPNQPGSGLTTVACPAQSSSTACPIFRGEIAVVPGRNEMYVWYVDQHDNDQGIWESINGGTTWTQISDQGITNCGDGNGCGTMDGTYNLELAAVPDGGGTDLYAGAVNLYKCQINYASPNCSGSGSNTFLNLTHAYGCSAIARVHPSQHALAFELLNNNTQVTMYFANDGGIYRALDGFSGLTTGSCESTNNFDSLNQTLGSMTQFVSFSQSSDGNTILGGTPGNGSPASQSLIGSTTWGNVDAGVTGFTAIDPTDSSDWFVSTSPLAQAGVNISRCQSGISCHSGDFQDDQVVSSDTLNGDSGAFETPFILDPQNSSELIVGTCRMWRGSSNGTGFTALSNNFENGGAGICTGTETNLVRSIATGGARDKNGLSSVMYAGTNGLGPLVPTVPPGGHVWVSTNVAGGFSSWMDQTGSINPSAFPISTIAMDSSDAAGLTAYVSIMGFHVSHVWKTTNGGASWTDFSGNLPDAPVNAILVDPGPNSQSGVVYVGTDVGVFSSSTTAPIWTDVGPAPASGQTGFLPNVAVTALALFDDGTDKWLRASTYGRGVWQYPVITTPDFLISITNTPMTVFAGSAGVFAGEVFSLNGYSDSVDLSCQPGVTSAPTCSFDQTIVQPSSSGTAFSLTASGAPAAYQFNVQGVGTDSGSTTHNASVTLNVVDFDLTTLSSQSVTLGSSAVSPPIAFQVTAAGPFTGYVNLSCGGLPSGATCSFQPGNVVTPTADVPVTVTLKITTGAATPVGTSIVTISGTVSGGPTKSESLSLTVIAGFSIAIANPSLSAAENTPATFSGTVTANNGYANNVNVSCGAGAPPTCSVAPAPLKPTSEGTSFTVTVSSNRAQSYSFVISAVGTDEFDVSHSFPVTFTSTGIEVHFSFSISPPSQSESIKAGNTATYQMAIAPCSTCGHFPNAVSLSFAGCPPLSTCSLDPVSVPAGTGNRNLTFTVQTTAATITARASGRWRGSLYLLCFGMPLTLLLGVQSRVARRMRQRLLALAFLTALLALSTLLSCGGGLQGGNSATPQPGTPAGTYYLSVTATMNASPATASQKADLNLTVGP